MEGLLMGHGFSLLERSRFIGRIPRPPDAPRRHHSGIYHKQGIKGTRSARKTAIGP
jgi:hypothetical protein